MKKTRFLIIIGTLFFLFMVVAPLAVLADDQPVGITVLADGLPISFDVKPLILDGRTLVPFRAIAESLDVSVNYRGSGNSRFI